MNRFLVVSCLVCSLAVAQGESEYYSIVTLPTPEGVKFEVGGMARMPDGGIACALRKGEVWLLENPYGENLDALRYRRIAHGLHEPLGLLYRDGALYTTQRSELTKLADVDGDGVVDRYRTVSNGWGVTGNYHEYAYGPVVDAAGRFWITLNQTIGTTVDAEDNAWRGWGMALDAEGNLNPMCAGMRSPAGIGANAAGDVFFTDQQGEWVPTNSLHQLRRGAFYGHAVSFASAEREGSPIKRPASIPDGVPIPTVRESIPSFRLPAVWFPYRKAGMSATGIVCDETGGAFGPFDEQLFVGDFTMAQISRVALEKVDGAYQGAVFNFRRGFQCAIVRMAWGRDGSLFIGETNRGWNSAGNTSYGLQRVVWTGETPFEMATVRARPSGFRIAFTKEVDSATVEAASFAASSFTYSYHNRYGSDEIDGKELSIGGVRLLDDGRTVDVTIAGLRAGYVHELNAAGVRSRAGDAPVHDTAWYTLNAIPE